MLNFQLLCLAPPVGVEVAWGKDVVMVPWGGRDATGKLSTVLPFVLLPGLSTLLLALPLAFVVGLLRWAPRNEHIWKLL